MHILVVGGAGYIGSHAVKALVKKGHDVTVVDALYTGHRKAVDPHAHFYQVDLRDTFKISKILRKHKIDAVIHFAAYSLVPESLQHPLMYFDNNVSSMISLLKAMQENKIRYLVFSSSAATYGIPAKTPITEDFPLHPINPYGETKAMMEDIIRWAANAYGIKFIALRYFNVAGASLDGSIGEDHHPETHLIPNILKSAADPDAEFTIFGSDYDTPDGTNVRDYVHVVDLIDAHLLALQYLLKNERSDVFNLGSAHGFSNLEILRAAMKTTGVQIPYTIGQRRGGDPDALIADSTKARQILGWQPKHDDLADILGTAWQWHQNHPQGYADR